MKILCCSLFLMLVTACAAPRAFEVTTPQAKTDPYPPVIEASAARQQAAEEAWRQLLSEFRLPETRLDFEPVLYTPRALPVALANQINLSSPGAKFGADEAREALRRFIERAHAVLSGDQRTNALLLKDLSLTSFSDEGSVYRAVYQQRSYQYPLANNYGQLNLVLSKTGALLQMSSRIVSPVLLSTELPGRPGISPDKLITPLLGREFTYTSIAGQPLNYKVSQRDEISVKELVIYPRVDNDRLAVHLAWQVEVGRGTTWTVYIDAMTGKELEVRPNFAS